MKLKTFPYGCTICHKSFAKLNSLGEHSEKIHSLGQRRNDGFEISAKKEDKIEKGTPATTVIPNIKPISNASNVLINNPEHNSTHTELRVEQQTLPESKTEQFDHKVYAQKPTKSKSVRQRSTLIPELTKNDGKVNKAILKR